MLLSNISISRESRVTFWFLKYFLTLFKNPKLTNTAWSPTLCWLTVCRLWNLRANKTKHLYNFLWIKKGSFHVVKYCLWWKLPNNLWRCLSQFYAEVGLQLRAACSKLINFLSQSCERWNFWTLQTSRREFCTIVNIISQTAKKFR